jgi:cytoskeleton protein RodZ
VEKTDRKNEFFEELKRTRESKGLRLEDIARRYRIRFSFLEAIESGSFDDLPEPVYTKTFIKTYAGALGVDAGPILAQYAKHIEKTLPSAPPEEAAAAKGPDAGKAVLAWFGMLGSRVIWTFLALAVLIGLGIYAFQDRPERPVPAKTAVREEARLPEKPAEVKPPEEPSAQPAQQPEAATPQAPQQQAAAPEPKKPEVPPPAEKKEPAPAPAPPAAGGTLSLTIEATEAAWVQVRADRTPAVQRLLQAGEKVSTEAREKITVDLGNAGGVQITFQGQSLGSPGKRGEVVHLVYPEGKRVEKKKPEEPKPAAE